MADPDLWFPGARLNQLAPVDGGSILGGRPKCLHHDTETSGFPSYSSGFWPNMTGNPLTGEVRQHIPANRAARALRNESGGVQTNRLNVFQIEWIGFANKVPFHPVMAEIAAWLKDVRGCPLTEGVSWTSYPSSFGSWPGRLTDAEWSTYSGHLGHQHVPENVHGDPGWPFPITKILEGDWFDMASQQDLRDVLNDVFQTPGTGGSARSGIINLARRAVNSTLGDDAAGEVDTDETGRGSPARVGVDQLIESSSAMAAIKTDLAEIKTTLASLAPPAPPA